MNVNAASPWERTRIHGIRRHVPTGTYYANKRAPGGGWITGSLETDNLKHAERRLAEKLRQRAETPAHPDGVTRAEADGLTFAKLAAVYLSRLDSGGFGALKANTVTVKKDRLKILEASWNSVPALSALPFSAARPAKLTYDHLLVWRKHFLDSGYAPVTYNKILEILRRLFDLALEYGASVPCDPRTRKTAAERLAKESEARPQYALPTPETLARILRYGEDTYKNKFSGHCRDLVEGLSWTGLRIGEARKLKVGHVNLAEGYLRVPPENTKGVKGTEKGRLVPILADARALFERLVRDALPDGRLFHVTECPHWLKAACKAAGWTEKFTHHSLRHYFATRCLEATDGDAPLVAGWLGHRDNGALLLRVYAHLCDKHQLDEAKKIRGWKRAEEPANIVKLAV